MSPSTGPTENPPATSYDTSGKETIAKRPVANEEKRSSSRSHHHHSRQPSNPFFLSRRASEQGSFSRKQRGERKSVTPNETLNSPEVRDNVGLATKPDIIHIVGISEEAAPSEFTTHQKRGVTNITILQGETRASEKHGVQPNTGFDLRKAFNPSLAQKTTLGAKKPSLTLKTSTASTHAANPAYSSAHLSPDILFHQSHPRKDGTVRGKIMRTVSQDDYLLARGANPRTGVVTPSVHSGSSSLDDREWSRIKEMSQQAKWRLKGDQWVSLSFDQPSPLPSPPYGPNDGARGRTLRIPPKPAHGRRPQHGVQVHDFEQHNIDSLTRPSHHTLQTDRTRKQNESGPPRAERPKDLVQSTTMPIRLSSSDYDTVIRRKPLGTPPKTRSAEKLLRSNELLEASTETVITKASPVEQARASSMPTPRKIRFYRPEDVKALPDLPVSKDSEQWPVEEESQSQCMSFLGLRPGEWREDVSDRKSPTGRDSKKRLPCLPTNDTPFRSHRLEKPNVKLSPRAINLTHINRLENQQRSANFLAHTEGRSAGLHHSRPTIPPRYYQLAEVTSMEQRPAHSGFTNKPAISHLPRLQPKPQCQPMCTNEQMTKNERAGAKRAAPTNPSTITPTITHITTVVPLPEDRLVSSSWREMPSPLRPGRQRADMTFRPVMSQRTEGTHSVPQVSPLKPIEEQYQWRMTGMSDSDISAVSTPVEGSPERDLIPRPLRPSHGNVAGLGGELRKVAAEGVIDANQAMKTCRPCKEPSLDGKRHNMHGSIPTQENRGAENIHPKVDFDFTSGLSQGTPEDHSSCCSECCAVGCHDSCLGHRSRSNGGSASGFAGGLGATKEAFRNSIRLRRQTRIRTSAGGSRETETEELAELDTPMSWEMSGPVSLGLRTRTDPHDFWGPSSGTKEATGGKRIASNASASSITTCDLPTAGGGIGAMVEALNVPFGALRMWVRKHPQLLALMQVAMLKLFEMSKHVVETMGKAYRVAYIYSKTGKISAGKYCSLSGFVRDCVKAFVYCLILGTVAMMVRRVLAVFAGAGSWMIWCLGWVAWVVKTVLGLGILW